MKKLLLFFSILLVSVLCTACVNNLAVQELNDKAKEYLEGGNTNAAICRLLSSIDLDGSVFETRYNLGVAYIVNEEYRKAEEQLAMALKIRPDMPNAFYSLGIAQEAAARDIVRGKEEGKKPDVDEISIAINEEKGLTPEQINAATEKLSQAKVSFEKYISLKPDAEDKVDVTNQIERIVSRIEEYKQQLNAPDTSAVE
jgi:tetratricopeptide (TPR) repeat protein